MILTPDQRLRVFVSSTLGELATERAAVRLAIEQLRLAPVMFELGARPHPPRSLYRAYLEQSHVFLAIYAERYGWTASGMEVSGLEDEYRLSGDRPKLVYVLDPAPEREQRLTDMLADVAADPLVRLRLYSSTAELASLVARDLADLLAEGFREGRNAGLPTTTSKAGTTPGDTGGPLPLPVATTSLIGREAELELVTSLLRRPDVRLVTITGMGGIGKSRVALEAAHRLGPDFPGGVVLVALSEVPEPGLVVTSIASRLGVRLDTTAPSVDAVAEALADRDELLVLLDNAEQVRDAAEDLAALVSTCPRLTLLVTSRSRVRLVAEHDVPLQPLSVGPSTDTTGFGELTGDPAALAREAEASDAVALFLDRASASRPDLDLATDPSQLAAVVELCRRLDGLPLAIELAAARVRLLPPTVILDRLDRSGDLPSPRLADLPDRQRTMRTTLDWSYDLLDPAHRELLADLSTFVGGSSLEAIEEVVGDGGEILESLAALVDHSLVDVDASVIDAPRFTMLETVREYARELLEASGRAPEVDAAHRRWVLHLADRAHRELSTVRHAEWLERLELEAGNIRMAGTRAFADHDPDTLATVCFDLWLWFWARHHTREARLWIERALDRPEELDPLARARVLWVVSGAAVEQGDNDTAVLRLAEASELFTELGDAEGLALCGFLGASLAPLSGDFDRAVVTFLETEARLMELGDLFVASICASTAGMLTAQQGRFDEAVPHLDRGLALAERIDNAMLRGSSCNARGFASLGRGDLDAAEDDLVDAARWGYESRNPETLSFACDGLAAVLMARGRDGDVAAALVGASHGLRERVGIVPWPGLREIMTAIADGVRATVGDEVFDEAHRRGKHLDVEAIVALARRAVDRPAPAAATMPGAHPEA